MGAPAAKENDQIIGTCVGHLMPGPTGQITAPPLPFSAPIDKQVARSVKVEGAAAVIVGVSWGLCQPAHAGLSDAWLAPPTQRGAITTGSQTVLVEGKPMAHARSQCTMCFGPATQLAATGMTVLVAER
jgi:uncharacterized Zn-binding protein involved in type VI secretion